MWSKNSEILANSSYGLIMFVNFWIISEETREASYKLAIILFVLSYLVDLRLIENKDKDYPDEV